jgi:hypothetical protein
LRFHHERWVEQAREAVIKRYEELPPDDITTAQTLRSHAAVMGDLEFLLETKNRAKYRLAEAFSGWLARAEQAKRDELIQQPQGDWPAFDRTAAGRKVLAKAFPDSLPALVNAEEAWVDESVESLIEIKLAENHARVPPRAETWRSIEENVRTLESLETSDNRFQSARKRLFDLAHVATQREITAHIQAQRYYLIFGVARKHAVDWDATARVLGADAVAKLDTLRATCAIIDALIPEEPPDVAPAPREKP